MAKSKRQNQSSAKGQKKIMNVSRRKGDMKTTRVILASSIPKPYMKVSGDGTDWKIRGLEVFRRVVTSGRNIAYPLRLNPTHGEIFPRLSNLANSFQRYSFKRVRMVFNTAAPATRSGGIGMAILETPALDSSGSEIPVDFVDLGSYPHSSVGTVANNLSTPWYEPKTGNEKFYISGSDNSDTVDPLKVFQGELVIMTGDSILADDGLLAGYMSLEYEVDLFGYRVPDQSVLNMYTGQLPTFIGGNTATQLVGWGLNMNPYNTQGFKVQERGYFPTDWFCNLGGNKIPSSQNDFAVVPRSMDLLNGTTVQCYVPVSATFAEPDSKHDEDLDGFERLELKRQKLLTPHSKLPSRSQTYYYNKNVVGRVPHDWIPCSRQIECKSTGMPAFEEAIGGPEAAGDVTVNLYMFDPISLAFTLLATSAISGGVTAQVASFVFDFLTNQIQKTILAYVVPTGTEKRGLTNDSTTYPNLSIVIPDVD